MICNLHHYIDFIRKTHGVCFLGEKQEKNTNRKLIDTYRREKCVFWRRSKQKNTRRVFFGGKARKKHKPEANRHEPESSPKLCVNSSFSYVSSSMLPLSSGDWIEWNLVCRSTLSYQKFCDRHSNHYDHPEELHQLVE